METYIAFPSMLGTPHRSHYISKNGWSERETLTYVLNNDRKIVMERKRLRGRKTTTVTAYNYNPKTVIYCDGVNEREEVREWETILRLEQQGANVPAENKMLAQAYGVVMWAVK